MSAVAEIAQLGAAVLRQQAVPITDVTTPETQALIGQLRATLANTEGVGLAAPQIGVSQRAIIVASRPTLRYPLAPVMEPTVMINSYFEILSDTTEKGWEGCLSIPGIRALVPRYVAIRVNYLDEQGRAAELMLNDFVARVFQHEYDHLDGKVYLDRVENNADIIAESEYFKLLQPL